MKLDLFSPVVAKFRSGLILAATFSLIVSQANAICISAFEVTVQVTLLDTKSGMAPKDYSEVVVWLVPVGVLAPASFPRDLPRYRMIQHNKTFEPRLLVVPVGSVVEFRNRDPWVHSAFSLSDSMRFDLGPRRPGGQRVVRFDHPGVAYVFCDIHPQMEAVVLAVESSYFGVSDKAGHISSATYPLEGTPFTFGTRMPRRRYSVDCTAPLFWMATIATRRRFLLPWPSEFRLRTITRSTLP